MASLSDKTEASKTIVENGKTVKEENSESSEKTGEVVSGQLQKKIDKKKIEKKEFERRIRMKRGVVFVKNLPHGFFEEQLQKYFEQFGRVTRLRLVRNTRTGASRRFAYIEFAIDEVAKIAAETMNGYLMFQKIVKSQYIPPEEQKYDYFKTSIREDIKNGKTVYISNETKRIDREMEKQNNWDDDKYNKRIAKNLAKLRKLKQKYPNASVDFDSIVVGAEKAEESILEWKKQKLATKKMKSESDINEGTENDASSSESEDSSSSESSSDDGSPKPGSILLIKKRKKKNSKRSESKESKGSENSPTPPKKSAIKREMQNLKDEDQDSENQDEDSDVKHSKKMKLKNKNVISPTKQPIASKKSVPDHKIKVNGKENKNTENPKQSKKSKSESINLSGLDTKMLEINKKHQKNKKNDISPIKKSSNTEEGNMKIQTPSKKKKFEKPSIVLKKTVSNDKVESEDEESNEEESSNNKDKKMKNQKQFKNENSKLVSKNLSGFSKKIMEIIEKQKTKNNENSDEESIDEENENTIFQTHSKKTKSTSPMKKIISREPLTGGIKKAKNKFPKQKTSTEKKETSGIKNKKKLIKEAAQELVVNGGMNNLKKFKKDKKIKK